MVGANGGFGLVVGSQLLGIVANALYDAKLVSHHPGIPTKSTLVPCGVPGSGTSS